MPSHNSIMFTSIYHAFHFSNIESAHASTNAAKYIEDEKRNEKKNVCFTQNCNEARMWWCFVFGRRLALNYVLCLDVWLVYAILDASQLYSLIHNGSIHAELVSYCRCIIITTTTISIHVSRTLSRSLNAQILWS